MNHPLSRARIIFPSALLSMLAPLALAVSLWGCQKDEVTEIATGTGGTPGVGGDIVTSDVGGAGGSNVGMPDGATDDGVVKPPTDATGGPDTAPPDMIQAETLTPVPDAGVDLPTMPPYAGHPWNDMPQMIPGIVQCSLYDVGGEGVAYHDGDAVDNGVAAARNDVMAPESTFRINEGVDLRTTRAGTDKYVSGADVQARQLYVGWTQRDEWINYTVTVAETGRYILSALVATMDDGARVTLFFEDGTTTGPRALPWTHSYTAWRFADNVALIDLNAGTHVLTMRFETPGINIEYLSFVKN